MSADQGPAKNWEAKKLSPLAAATLTPEQAAAEEQHRAEWEEAYQQYAQLADAYERVIRLEDCPLRKQQLCSLLDQLHEDNK